MTVDEISARLRARLQEEYGVDETAILMDRPPGGWNDLVTNASLDQRFTEFEARFDLFEARIGAELHTELHAQTWRFVTTTIAALTSLTGATAIFVAIATSQ